MRIIPLEQPLADLLAQIDDLQAEQLRLYDAGANGQDVAAGQKAVEKHMKELQVEHDQLQADIFASLTPFDRVQLARHPERPYTLDYLSVLLTDWTELHGDRRFADDQAIVAGLGLLGGEQPVAAMGHQKGRNVAERKARGFGQAGPAGYRKAMRIMELGARFGHPILTFIDTPGAACSPEAEELGISEALAASQLEMARLPVPTVCTVLGEGGSGGAIALGVADHIIMLEHSYYSVIAPEACASIIWRDASRPAEAAEALRLGAADALEFGFCDEVLPEPLGGAHKDPSGTATALLASIQAALTRLSKLSPAELIEQRWQRFERMGQVTTLTA
ncbi:MAG TPA: acetyl-CoA carboxylase carboxyl transferase subunit alpha [Armatimonadetes bacterium]|nr:acetyl-CoA carboxylase carboxyl transferase subunit alpha [Armatimonadota bacterium]